MLSVVGADAAIARLLPFTHVHLIMLLMFNCLSGSVYKYVLLLFCILLSFLNILLTMNELHVGGEGGPLGHF